MVILLQVGIEDDEEFFHGVHGHRRELVEVCPVRRPFLLDGANVCMLVF